MAKKPLISVVIPSYNHEKYVVQAIESVFKQTYSPIELIIVDDGSSDNSVSVIQEAIEKLSKKRKMEVHFFPNSNIGAHNAINWGLRKARGEVLTILNSDDFYTPNRLATMYAALKSSRSELVFSKVRHVDEVGRAVASTHEMKNWYDNAIAKKSMPSTGFLLLMCNIAVTTGNLVFTRRLFETLDGFRNYTIMHDYDFILRALFHTEPVFIRKTLMSYRVHSENTCVTQRHLSLAEGPSVAFNFFKMGVLDPTPKNKRAPCKTYWDEEFTDFWKKEHPWILGWIGGHIPDTLL